MRSLQQFWSVRRIGEDKVTLARLGPLRLWLARADKEWGMAYHQGEGMDLMDFAQVPRDVLPDDLEWSTFLFRRAPRDFMFKAVSPNYPLAIKCSRQFNIPKGETGELSLMVPVWINICVISENETQDLMLIPSENLNKTWFGNPRDGFLAYANSKEIDLESGIPSGMPNQIIYEISINNSTEQMLSFHKICLDLSNTGIYSGMNHLWGSKISLDYQGDQNESLVEVMDAFPEKENDLIEVSPAKTGITRAKGCSLISCCNS